MSLIQMENVQILDSAADWRDAIYKAVKPLEEHGYVESRYKDGIIENVEKFGPYIVIADQIALPHARPKQGAIKTQIGVTLFREGVSFEGKDVPVKLFIVLSAEDSNSHMEALADISERLSSEATVKKLLNAADETVLYNCLA